MKKNIMVVFGGKSSEHDISKLSAKAVLENINKEKYNVVPIGITRDGQWVKYTKDAKELDKIDLNELIETDKFTLPLNKSEKTSLLTEDESLDSIDVIFPVLHGPNGEDGTIQGLFELLDKPYVGCGVLSSSVGMDKGFSKIVFDNAGIPQGDYVLFTRKDYEENKNEIIDSIENKLGYPTFVKPANAGSSVGVSKAKNREELKVAIVLAIKYDRRILVEEELTGKEVECAVLGNERPMASILGEIIPCNEFYDYEAKYLAGESETKIPADIPKVMAKKVREYAINAYKALDASGLSRVDFFVDVEKNSIKLIEINTLPGFTSISMYSKLWEASGISYSELIDKLIEYAILRYNDNKKDYNLD
jgi:D-alanine-D-alanine ligase